MMSNPFDYLNSINVTKKNMMRGTENDELAEKDYNAFMVNRGLSYFQDTIALANEMNKHHFLDKKLQYEFFINIVRPRKRFCKWSKPTDNNDLDAIKEYYNYGTQKALQALSVLTKDDIENIKIKLYKGGKT
jgi:hypothetical protein